MDRGEKKEERFRLSPLAFLLPPFILSGPNFRAFKLTAKNAQKPTKSCYLGLEFLTSAPLVSILACFGDRLPLGIVVVVVSSGPPDLLPTDKANI